jgi:hypothetical protein
MMRLNLRDHQMEFGYLDLSSQSLDFDWVQWKMNYIEYNNYNVFLWLLHRLAPDKVDLNHLISKVLSLYYYQPPR